MTEKYREVQEDLFAVFIDLEKAFDHVLKKELWQVLRNKKVSEDYIRLISEM